ncbi:MAG TPA: adenylyl-sulfate kinase [Solirubrobacteraceae bacterium]|nr:adenylyl-sulfate kinase [Solirubrobacteraceae bacterium]
MAAPKGGNHVRGMSIANKRTADTRLSRDTEIEAPDAAPSENPPQDGREHSPNVRWQRTALTRSQRWESLGQAGATIWFTGLPAAGKSTIAAALEERLVTSGRPAFMLDGDNLRHGLNGDLGFNEAARSENVRRTAHVARLLAESGTLAIVSLVSPYAQDREAAASLHADADLPFLEIFVDAPLRLCEQRDPKGLYARARAGKLAGLTGVDAPYETPLKPDLTLHSGEESVESAVERVVQALAERVPRPVGRGSSSAY